MYQHISKRWLPMWVTMMVVSTGTIARDFESDITWLTEQVSKHPQVIAAKQAMDSTLTTADSFELPLYNPVIGSNYDSEGQDDIYSIGISQTIDRTDKRGSRTEQAVYSRISAKQNYAFIIQQKKAEVLNVLINYQATQKRAALASEQEQQLENLLEIVKKRSASGDLGQLDTELAYLSLSQRFGQTARVQAQLKRVEAQIRELLPDWPEQNLELETSQWQKFYQLDAQIAVENHPMVQAAKAQWQVAEMVAEVAAKNKKADPTIGVSAGQINNDGLLSLSFSMPLNVRNDFSLAYKAANQQSLSAESNYQAVKRKQYYAILASQQALNEYKKRFDKWQNLMQGRAKDSENLLQRQWNVGDISTTQYLLTLQQRTEGLLAGIELEQEYQSALIQLLLDTAQLTNGDKQ